MEPYKYDYIDSAFVKRIKSFAWRGAMMVAAFAFAYIAENIASLELDPSVTMVLGLVFGEISKALNTKHV